MRNEMPRGCAELEDMLTLFACKLTGLSEARVLVMIGGLTVERRLEVVGRLAEICSPAAHTAFQHCFDANFRKLKSTRNDVAHAVFLGYDTNGELAFMAQRASGLVDGVVRQTVASYSNALLEQAARLIEQRVTEYPALLEIESLRASRSDRVRFDTPAPKKPARPRDPRHSAPGA